MKYITLLSIVLMSFVSKGQIVTDASDLKFNERLRFGGNVGLSIGSFTQILAEPSVAIIATDRYVPGVSFLYQYVNVNNYFGVGEDFSSHYFGFRQFNQFWITENIFAAGELEVLNYEFIRPFSQNELVRDWVESVFVGAGYRTAFAGQGFVTISLLYNLSYNSQSPYASPFVPRVGIFF